MKSILMVVPYGFNDRLANFPEFILSRLLAREGWSVHALTQRERGEPKKHTVHGISVVRYEGAVRAIAWLLFFLLFKRPSVVHVHMLRNNRAGILAAVLAKILRIPLAFSEAGLLHDHYLTDDRDDPLGNPIRTERVLHGTLRSRFFHLPLMLADAVVFYSKHNVPIASALGLKATYIPLIVDGVRWQSMEKAAPFSIPERYALFVGQMKARKGWDVLLNAIPFIPAETMPKFVFVSSTGTETREYTMLVQGLNIEGRVVFLGKLTTSELHEAFTHASLVVVPSRYEGFGLVPIDAFETSKPVVASRVEALTDFLIDGQNALLVPPKDPRALADAITRVLSDSALRDQLIRGGSATLARMRSDEPRKAWLDFYNRVARS